MTRVRFAPSPTGPLHIGGVRTALYNYLFAKKTGGEFILRIEDTDQNRLVPGAEDYIIKALEWCGMHYDEGIGKDKGAGPYRQSERKPMYRQFAEQLVESGHAYYAFDTAEDLDEMRTNLKKQGNPSPQYNSITRQYMKNSIALPADEVEKRLSNKEDYVIRLKMPRNEEIKFEDEIRGWVSFQSSQLDDKVLLKGDGMPTYHLANIVDDYHMKITHVIRGEEWLPSAPTHVMLYRYLGWEESMPKFAHLPLILRPDGNGKLSKRDGDRLGFPVFPLDWQGVEADDNAKGFKERGFLPEAFTNMLAFLGWNPGTEQELFTMEELIEAFSLKRIGKSGAKFDFEKAKWFNQQYLKEKSGVDLAKLAKPYLVEAGFNVKEDYLSNALDLLKERICFISEVPVEGVYFFSENFTYDEKVVRKKWKPELIPFFEAVKNEITDTSNMSSEAVEAIIKGEMGKGEYKFGEILPVFRVMLCGTVAGPPIFDVAALLGKEEVVKRMEKFLKEN